MADVRFDIAIEANSLGVDSSADQLNALADRITFTSRVATEFDRAVAAVRSRLGEATEVTKAAAAALAVAEKRYGELEAAANRAAKEVEKAAAAGKDTTALKAAATAASAAMSAQAKTVDELRARADAASAAQTKLAGTLKTLEGQQATAAARTKAGITKELEAAGKSMDKVGAPEKASAMSKYGSAVKGLGSATAMAAAAWVVFAAAGVGALGMLGKFGWSIPQNAANVQRLTAANQRMQIGMQKLFAGLKWDSFSRGLEDVMTLFDAGTSSANGMKKLTETVLQPLIDGAAKAAPYVKEMFKGIIFGALQVVIAVLKIRNAIFAAMSPETRAAVKAVIDQVFTLENAFKAGTAIAVVLAAVFVALTIALISLAASEIMALLPILLIVGAIALVIAAIMNWSKVVDTIKTTLSGWVTAAKDAAKNLVTGIVDGIKNGAGLVYDALKNMALGGITAFKNALGIKSPSTVMKLQAKYTADGYVEGIEDAEGRVSTALETMVTPPDTAAATPAAPQANTQGQGGGPTQITFTGPITFGSDADRSMFAEFTKMLADALGGAVVITGGGEAPAT